MKNATDFDFPLADTIFTAAVVGGLGLTLALIGVVQGVQAVFA